MKIPEIENLKILDYLLKEFGLKTTIDIDEHGEVCFTVMKIISGYAYYSYEQWKSYKSPLLLIPDIHKFLRQKYNSEYLPQSVLADLCKQKLLNKL